MNKNVYTTLHYTTLHYTTLHLGLRNLNVGGTCAAPSTYKNPLRTCRQPGVFAGDFCVYWNAGDPPATQSIRKKFITNILLNNQNLIRK